MAFLIKTHVKISQKIFSGVKVAILRSFFIRNWVSGRVTDFYAESLLIFCLKIGLGWHGKIFFTQFSTFFHMDGGVGP